MIDAKVEQEAADGRDDHECCDGVLLEAEGGHGVDSAEEKAKAVQARNERPEVHVRQRQTSCRQREAQTLCADDWKEGFDVGVLGWGVQGSLQPEDEP